MDWLEIELGGKQILVCEPPAASGPAVLYLHDARGTHPADVPGLTAELVRRRWRCIAPAAGCSWWLDRFFAGFDTQVTPEQHLMQTVLPWMVQTWQVGPSHRAVVGVGMGGQGALRLGFRHAAQFPIVAGIDAAIDFHQTWGLRTTLETIYPTREAARRDTVLFHIAADAYPRYVWFACSPHSYWYEGNERLREKLAAMGLPHEAVLADHPLDRYVSHMFTYLDNAFRNICRQLL